jgi:hypothetical protein
MFASSIILSRLWVFTTNLGLEESLRVTVEYLMYLARPSHLLYRASLEHDSINSYHPCMDVTIRCVMETHIR